MSEYHGAVESIKVQTGMYSKLRRTNLQLCDDIIHVMLSPIQDC